MLGKLIVSIGVEEKLRLVSELMGAGARFWEYPFETSECLKHNGEFGHYYSGAIDHIMEVVREQGELATKMVEKLEVYRNEEFL